MEEKGGTLLASTEALLGKWEKLSERVESNPRNTRLRDALRRLDKQLVSNLAHRGFTPSDRARLGLVRVKQQSRLEQMMAFRAS